jgi:hypothetical protein
MLSGTLSSPAVANRPTHYPLIPGESIGPVHLGELESSVHIGRSVTNGPGSIFYPDYSITVGYMHGRAAGLSISELAVDPNAMVSPGRYQTATHPTIAVGVPIGRVRSAYPHAQCAKHVIPSTQPQHTENCLLRSHHNHTFFAGGATTHGSVLIAAILVSTAAAGPQAP